MSHTYYCLLGNTPALSLLELSRMLPESAAPTEVQPDLCSVVLTDDQAARTLLERSGGVVKILKHIAELPSVEDRELEHAITEHLLTNPAAKITFAIAELGRDHLPALDAGGIKRSLKDAGKKVRYQETTRHGLSAAVLSHHAVAEIVALDTGNQTTILAESVAVQNIDHWTKKDRHKPYADRKKGMLPPKLARMLVNIALGTSDPDGKILLDPFCGSGGVLIEAIELGLSVRGSDTDTDAVSGTKKNLAWFTQDMESTSDWQVQQADATKVRVDRPIHFLATEPFLGKPKPEKSQLKNIFTGLYKLYLGAFKHWKTVLVDGAQLVVIFPRARGSEFDMSQDTTLEALIDKLASLGYTTKSGPVTYFRPQARIARDVYLFEYRAN